MRTDIPEGSVMVLNPPNIKLMMSGVSRAYQDRTGLITLVYEDGQTESRHASFAIEDMEFFSVVSFVQSDATPILNN